MLKLLDTIDRCRVPVGKKFKLREHSTDWNTGDDQRNNSELQHEARRLLEEDDSQLSRSQELIHASQSWAVLVILQGMDASGKDATISQLVAGLNPQGVDVASFRQPSTEELQHNFLWRYSNALPARGRIGIFNRSYYEEVVIAKIHPEILANQRIPDANPAKNSFWKARYKEINQFERHLVRNGTLIVKFFLNLSKDEQKRRLLNRIEDPSRNWNFSLNDLKKRANWEEYMGAYEEMLNTTTTKYSPWHVIPADDKATAHLLAIHILSHSIQKLGLKFPELTPSQYETLIECKFKLEAEAD